MPKILILLSLMIVIPSPEVNAQGKFKNKIDQRRQEEAFLRKLDEIPVYREKIEGDYQILGPVHADDMLTQKKDGMIRQMRRQAHQMGADAIMEFTCKPRLRSLFQTCEGFAIRSKNAM